MILNLNKGKQRARVRSVVGGEAEHRDMRYTKWSIKTE